MRVRNTSASKSEKAAALAEEGGTNGKYTRKLGAIAARGYQRVAGSKMLRGVPVVMHAGNKHDIRKNCMKLLPSSSCMIKYMRVGPDAF